MEALAEIWMDYDGIRSDYAVTATYGRNAVWPDYEMVLHMNSLTDSSANATVTNSGATLASGIMGDGYDFSSDRLATTTFTHGTYVAIGRDATNDGNLSVFMAGPSPGGWLNTNLGFTVGVWNKVDVVYNGSSLIGYLNATAFTPASKTGSYSRTIQSWVNPDSLKDYSAITGVDGGGIAIGDRIRTTSNWPLDGKLDEFRVRFSAITANWITTEYNNQNANGSFWEATDAGGGAAAQAARRGAVMMG